jgi:phage terminase large subunit
MKIRINPEMFLPYTRDWLDKTTPVQIYFGSASSGKSYQIMHYAVIWALRGEAILITRKEASQLRRSVWSEVKKAISNMGLDHLFDFSISTWTITSRIGNGSIQFTGMDDSEKLKSITPPKASAFSVAIMEESDAYTEDDITQIQFRMRGECEFPKRLLLIFNPVSKGKMKFVYDTYFKAVGWNDEEDMVYEDDSLYIQRCIYKDNTYLSEDDLEKMERLKKQSPRKYRVFGEGKFGASGKNVLDVEHYWVEDFDIFEILRDRNYELRLGGDFGFVHHSAFVITAYNKKLHRIYVLGLVYENEITKEELGRLCVKKMNELGLNVKTTSYWDSAEPASIRTLQNVGLRGATRAKKGSGSVTRQIDFLQSCDIVIHPSCDDLYYEVEALSFKKKQDGTYSEDIDDSTGDDAFASLRYAFSYDAWKAGSNSIKGSSYKI